MRLKEWFLVAGLACGCAKASTADTVAHPYGEIRVTDGAADGAGDAPPADVASDRPGDAAMMTDAGDAGTPDVSDTPQPTDRGADASDAATDVADATPPVDAPDAPPPPDVPTDISPDRAEDVGMDAPIDALVDSGTDLGIPDTSDAAPPTDTPADEPTPDVTPDVPVDTGPSPCPSGQTRCPAVTGVCVDTRTSTAHCGRCDNPCSMGQVCSGGACGSICAPTETMCPSGCVDTRTSVGNCGSCGTVCSFANAAATCASSACALGTCNTGFDNCNSTVSDGCEAPLNTTTNCGRCGNRCSFANATATCTASACALGTCSSSWGNCDGLSTNGCETFLSNDRNNCGVCGRVCASYTCSGSSCVPPVAPNLEAEITDPVITGFEIRVISLRAPNPRGLVIATVTNAQICQAPGLSLSTPRCRFNWRQVVQPALAPMAGDFITSWADNAWTVEIRPLTASGYLCPDGNSTCAGRWNETAGTFRGITFRCTASGAPGVRLTYNTVLGAPTSGAWAIIPRVTDEMGAFVFLCGRL